WTQESLPAGVPEEASLNSIAFAGDTAYVTWSVPVANEKLTSIAKYEGGVIVNEGAGWRVESDAAQALQATVGSPAVGIPQVVAALAERGVAIAGQSGHLIAREGPGASWQAAPGGKVGFPVALAAFREGGRIRAMISVEPAAIGIGAREKID